MVKTYEGDGVVLRKLQKENEKIKAIAKIQKNKVKKLEAELIKMEGYLAEYNCTLKANTQHEEESTRHEQDQEMFWFQIVCWTVDQICYNEQLFYTYTRWLTP